MPQAGDITIGAEGTRQGVYTPQLRMYYDSERYGVLCDVFDLKHLGKTRDRKEALRRGKAWLALPGAEIAAEEAWDVLHNGKKAMGLSDAECGARITAALTKPSAA